MKKYLLILFIILFLPLNVFADNSQKAGALVQKARTAKNEDAKYEYLHAAEKLYLKDYESNPSDINTLVNLSKVYQMLEQRPEAKLYILRAYNIEPGNADLQKQMGDFYYNFGEYSTAIEYYNLSLSDGNIKDFETNLQTAKCYEKLGDKKYYTLYYQISGMLNPSSNDVKKKLNEINSASKEENAQNPDKSGSNTDKKFKYLFKDNPSDEE